MTKKEWISLCRHTPPAFKQGFVTKPTLEHSFVCSCTLAPVKMKKHNTHCLLEVNLPILPIYISSWFKMIQRVNQNILGISFEEQKIFFVEGQTVIFFVEGQTK